MLTATTFLSLPLNSRFPFYAFFTVSSFTIHIFHIFTTSTCFFLHVLSLYFTSWPVINSLWVPIRILKVSFRIFFLNFLTVVTKSQFYINFFGKAALSTFTFNHFWLIFLLFLVVVLELNAILTEAVSFRYLLFDVETLITFSFNKFLFLIILQRTPISLIAFDTESVFFVNWPTLITVNTFSINHFFINFREILLSCFLQHTFLRWYKVIPLNDVIVVLVEEEVHCCHRAINIRVYILWNLIFPYFVNKSLYTKHPTTQV